ncbi:hypothetical protein HYW19_03040 [Candidatus Woesearchaeota archaeon]|nr:hypothetical protein [Candidatus Woesearchaeota archaeon]
MAKIHTLVKRRKGLGTAHGHYCYFHRIGKRHRPKTFNTEEAVNAWALKQGLGPEQYYIKSVKHNKRFQVVMHDRKDKKSF